MLKRSKPCKLRGKSVNLNRSTRIDTRFARTLCIFSIRVRDVKRQMKPAPRIFSVDQVLTFGSLVITLPLFPSGRPAPESDSIHLKNMTMSHQSHRVVRLNNDDSVSPLLSQFAIWEPRRASGTRTDEHCRDEHRDALEKGPVFHRLGSETTPPATSGSGHAKQLPVRQAPASHSSVSLSFEITLKSSSVVVSPLISPFVASSRSSRLMIFPDRVFGN